MNPHSVALNVRQMASTPNWFRYSSRYRIISSWGGRVPLRKTLTPFARSHSRVSARRSHVSAGAFLRTPHWTPHVRHPHQPEPGVAIAGWTLATHQSTRDPGDRVRLSRSARPYRLVNKPDRTVLELLWIFPWHLPILSNGDRNYTQYGSLLPQSGTVCVRWRRTATALSNRVRLRNLCGSSQLGV